MGTTAFAFGTLLKAIAILIGLGLTFWNLVKGFSSKDDVAKKKALKFFLLTFAFVFLLSIIDYLLIF